jgi:hypothetical protein
VSVVVGVGTGDKCQGTISFRSTLETPLYFQHSLLILFFWKKNRRAS